jgi:hypothetical protein
LSRRLALIASATIRDSHIVFFQLPQADQRFLEIVVSEVLPPGRELLESAMRCAGGLHERIVKLPHCIGEWGET